MSRLLRFGSHQGAFTVWSPWMKPGWSPHPGGKLLYPSCPCMPETTRSSPLKHINSVGVGSSTTPAPLQSFPPVSPHYLLTGILVHVTGVLCCSGHIGLSVLSTLSQHFQVSQVTPNKSVSNLMSAPSPLSFHSKSIAAVRFTTYMCIRWNEDYIFFSFKAGWQDNEWMNVQLLLTLDA